MAGLKTLLGLYPNTSKYEKQRNELENEFKALHAYEISDELARYRELEQFVDSEEFRVQKIELHALRYANSAEYSKEQEYIHLKKDSALKLFYKTQNSTALKSYLDALGSDKLKIYKELEAYVSSEEFLNTKKHFGISGAKRFEMTESGKKLAAYNSQKNSDLFKAYAKFVGHKYYPVFAATQNSDRLFRFEELKKLTASSSFIQKQNSMKKNEFAATEEGNLLVEFRKLVKSNDIVKYFKMLGSAQYPAYTKLFDSVELSSFQELERFISSPEFRLEKSIVEKQTFRDTAEYKKLLEFESLKKDAQIKHFLKFSQSKELANYNSVKGSEKLNKYESLLEYVKSAEFIEKKKYLQMSPKLRWKQSEAYARFVELENLKKTQKIKWYFKYKDHPKFNWFRTWKPVFTDDFNTGKLDASKWLTRYYWGEELMQDGYSLNTEKHHISDGANLELNGTILKIHTKKEHAEGKKWDPEFGFIPGSFEYTSGLINSGKSFKQKYGWFEARIKMSRNPKVMNAFWMVGDQMVPHIDIVKAYNKCSFGIHYDEHNEVKKSIGRNRFTSGYHIFSLEWSPEAIVWRINGLEVKTIKENIPAEEMYLTLSAGLYDEIQSGLPDSMEIDWVKCYSKN